MNKETVQEPRNNIKVLRTPSFLLFQTAFLLVVGCTFGVRAQTAPPEKFISLNEAVGSALRQASGLSKAKFDEAIAAEDVYQARKAFLPKVSSNPGLIYNSPSYRSTAQGMPKPPSYLGANAISEFQGTVTVSGELDTSGRLRAERRRALALLDAARLGTEAARRNLVNATEESYFGLALAEARRRSAEEILASARQFEATTKLLVDGGETAPIDLIRARVQTASRQDELSQALTDESIAEETLKAYVGYDPVENLTVTDLQTLLPAPGELGKFAEGAVSERPELKKLEAESIAADAEADSASSARRPQFTYSLDGGFISDSLRPNSIGASTGVRVTVGVNVPIFDWGISKSRETQAKLKSKAAKDSKLFASRMYRTEFRASLAQAGSAASRIRSLAANVTDAEKILDVAVSRYRAGETQIIEVTDAQTQIVTQRSSLLRAIYDYQVALSRLRRATGQ